MTNARHEAILAIIQQHDVTTQTQLQQLLEAQGFSVTQATVSRDIHQLHLQKKMRSSGKRCYVRTRQAVSSSNLLSDFVSKIDIAMNAVVLHCQPGTAQTCCALIDDLKAPQVVGTIAGDATIFILTRSESDAQTLLVDLESHIWG